MHEPTFAHKTTDRWIPLYGVTLDEKKHFRSLQPFPFNQEAGMVIDQGFDGVSVFSAAAFRNRSLMWQHGKNNSRYHKVCNFHVMG